MARRVLLILVVIFTIAFMVSRVDSSKSISSEYILLSKIEEQNMNQILRAVKYNIPSFSQSGDYINSRPKNGIVTIDTATDDYEFLKSTKLNFNNNYMFPMEINYTNSSKKLDIRSNVNMEDSLELKDFMIINDMGEGRKVRILTSP